MYLGIDQTKGELIVVKSGAKNQTKAREKPTFRICEGLGWLLCLDPDQRQKGRASIRVTGNISLKETKKMTSALLRYCRLIHDTWGSADIQVTKPEKITILGCEAEVMRIIPHYAYHEQLVLPMPKSALIEIKNIISAGMSS